MTKKEKSNSRSSIGARRNPATETAILDAASKIVAEKGMSGLKMETVARAAKAGKATLYRWWPTRGALILAVYQREKPAVSYQDTGNLTDDLHSFASELSAIWKTEFGAYFKAIIAEAQSDPDVNQELERYRSQRLEGLLIIFKRAEKRGELPAGQDHKPRAELMMSMMWQRLLTNRLNEDIDGSIRLLAAKP
ncbi:TetR/AcrR family transcriptional regulator [Cohaesibacter celericrescens]|uniref:TetR family transcriptional regulator n=1 Tax=Cohaesibacter celericrescens TaxID=2067669 RepID=A0A2N5XP67_9HYPH|nr:TetR/AcrR family transcriptional regulator [Cohaesibacter celericrescens]PLW76284.1 TetR family transcriptional regulator [Cohaesibacter celericrescens]